MHRPVSPLLHDYKSSYVPKSRQARRLPWFAVGILLPLVGVGVLLVLQNAAGNADDNLGVELIDEQMPVLASEPAPDPEPADVESLPTEVTVTGAVEAMEPAVTAMVIADTPGVSNAAEPLPAGFHPPLIHPDDDFELIRVTVKRGDTLDRIFRSHNIDLGDLAQIARLPEAKSHLRIMKPGDEIEIRRRDRDLISLSRELDLTTSLLVTRQDGAYKATMIDRPVEYRRRLAYGRISSSLFESGAEAGLSDKVIMNLAGIFAWDVDFVLDIRSNDSYYVLFEEVWQDNDYVSAGEIVAAEFNNNGKTYQAIRYIDEDGRSGYFTPEGRSVRKAFIRAPVDFSRISSRFNPSRRHPILNTIRAHRGVDYAAPAGTPIKAAGDGKVIFRGVKGGYGNTVILQHGSNITTLYAHMSRFDKGAKTGSRVRQGQTIGYVGSSGLATAAHLHYEYRLNGVHRNPRTVELPQADPISADKMQDFLAKSSPILDELLQYKRTEMAAVSTD